MLQTRSVLVFNVHNIFFLIIRQTKKNTWIPSSNKAVSDSESQLHFHCQIKSLTATAANRWLLVQRLKLPAWKVVDRGFEPRYGIQVSKEHNVSSLLTRKDSILWEASVTPRSSELGLRPPGFEFESRVWRAVSSHSSHHPQEVLLAQLSHRWPKTHIGGLKPPSFHSNFYYDQRGLILTFFVKTKPPNFVPGSPPGSVRVATDLSVIARWRPL